MKSRRPIRSVAFAAVGILALAACSGSPDDDGGDDATADGATGGIVTFANGEPQNPLIPTMTNEVYGSVAVSNLFAGLVYYDADGGVNNEVAESIESEDSQTWTVTLEEGWTFSDGSPVTAQSFVDAWNYGALLSNAQNLSYFFEPIEGYSGETDSELTGLEVVSDTEFTIRLTQPEADFPLRLGYAAFYPLPEAFFEDPEAFGEEPVGNGPYVLDAWEHDSVIRLLPNPDYQGDRVPANGGLELLAYTDEDSAYNDLLANNVDIVRNVPASAFATFEDDLGERAVNQPAATIQVLNVPEWLPEFQGDAGLLRRQAISRAIDRVQITETVFAGSRTPASDFTSPVIEGWSDSVPGNEVLEYDEQAAQDLWAQAEDIEPWGDRTLQLASNADSDHQAWIDAACNNIRNVLSIECEFLPYPTFDEFLDARDSGEVPGLFRGGWLADYPSMSNFLGPIYGTGAGSNDAQYSNPEFDDLLTRGNGADSPEEATELYIQAQEVLFRDLPGIPLWYQNATGGYAETVEDVVFGWDGEPLLHQVTKEG